jgi:RimJ/RimL family protein N-acetyltransferase
MIYGERIRFRHAERADLPQFVDWLNDPDVRQGISMYLPMSLAEEEQWFEGMLQRPPNERIFVIEIRDGDGWRMIGSTGFHEIDWRNQKAEFGILIGEKSEWNKGYGTEAACLMLRHGFETLNLHRIQLKVFSDNPRAIRAYEKAGYVLEGRQREAAYRGGRYLDDLLMSVLRHEWELLKA